MKPTYFVRRAESPDSKHETLEAAQAKAKAMAESEPGQVFEILRCVGIAQTSKASTFWMDGEFPPEKPRYRQLENGEQTMRTDEFLTPQGIWQKSIGGYTINPVHFPHRRPL